MLKNRPPHQASAGAEGRPKRPGSSAWRRTAGCTAFASATSGAKPAPRAVSGRRPSVSADGQSGEADPEARRRDRAAATPARPGAAARPRASPSTTAWATNSTASVERARARRAAAAGTERPPRRAARRRSPTTNGREGEGLQEDVEVEAGQREAPRGRRPRPHEGPGARGPQLARQPVGRERGERQVQGQQPGHEDGARPQRVEQVRAGRGRAAGTSPRRRRGSRWRAGPRAAPAPRRAAGGRTSP